MRWSWKVGKLFRIGIFIHATFPLLLAYVAYLYYSRNQSVFAAVIGVLFMLAVFAIVVMHELGHALTARRFGIETRDIILLPIGGVARLERMPDDPKQELLIAIAGPAVNVALALIIVAILLATGQPVLSATDLGPGAGVLHSLLAVNVTLILFNALPAFPMDGGRVLRALLAMRMSFARATQIAATVGKLFAVGFVIYGLTTETFTLALIGVFVWMGADGEASMARVKHDLGTARTSDVVIRDVMSIAPNDTLEKAVEGVLAGFQADFPVVESGTVVGLLTREDLLKALSARGRTSLVGEAMRTTFPVVAEDEPIEQVFAKLQGSGLRTIPVIAGGVFQGVVTTENIAEFLMVQAALSSGRRNSSS